MKTKPISPDQLKKDANVPDFVIKIVNKLIAEAYAKHGSFPVRIEQDSIVAAICHLKDVHRADVFDKGWLNFEDTYRSNGWRVEYDKPGYNETYPAVFKFYKK